MSKIWPFCFVSERWLPLMDLCVQSLERLSRTMSMTVFVDKREPVSKIMEYCAVHGLTVRPRLPDIGVWPEWKHVTSFYDICGVLADDRRMADDDYVVHLDTDMAFLTPEIFEYIKGDDMYGFAGDTKLQTQRFGPWSWYSGFCMFFRVGALRRMISLINHDKFKEEIREAGCSFMFDVCITYLMQASGASRVDLPWRLSDQDIEAVFRGQKQPESVVHFLGMWGSFLGETSDKFGIPEVIKAKGGLAKLLEAK